MFEQLVREPGKLGKPRDEGTRFFGFDADRDPIASLPRFGMWPLGATHPVAPAEHDGASVCTFGHGWRGAYPCHLAEAGLAGGRDIQDAVYAIILFSITATAVLGFMGETGRLTIYEKIFGKYGREVNPAEGGSYPNPDRPATETKEGNPLNAG